MTRIYFSHQFKVNYRKRIAQSKHLVEEFVQAVEVFQEDRKSLAIKDHQLERKMYKYRAFSVSEDIRVVYLEKDDHILFVDIGTHEQVYYG